MVGDVGSEVNREPAKNNDVFEDCLATTIDILPNTHDQVDHGDGVKVDAPECHEAEDANLDGNNGESHPKRADWVGNEDQGDNHHDPCSYCHALNGGGQYDQELEFQVKTKI